MSWFCTFAVATRGHGQDPEAVLLSSQVIAGTGAVRKESLPERTEGVPSGPVSAGWERWGNPDSEGFA